MIKPPSELPPRRPSALFDCPHKPVPVNLPFYSHPDMGGAQSAVMGSNYLYNVNGRTLDSAFGVIGAQYGVAAVNASSQISSGNMKLRVGMLEKAWEEVE